MIRKKKYKGMFVAASIFGFISAFINFDSSPSNADIILVKYTPFGFNAFFIFKKIDFSALCTFCNQNFAAFFACILGVNSFTNRANNL